MTARSHARCLISKLILLTMKLHYPSLFLVTPFCLVGTSFQSHNLSPIPHLLGCPGLPLAPKNVQTDKYKERENQKERSGRKVMCAPGWVLAGEMHRHLSIIYCLENRLVLQERHAFSGPESQEGISESGRAETGLRVQLEDLSQSPLTWVLSIQQSKA